MQETILKIEHISKFYPGATALNDVSFEIKKGEVRALVGENGVGKSTLIKCIMGVEKPDKGRISMNYNGQWVVNTNVLETQSHGVHANYQHVNIAPDLSIVEDYYLGRQPKAKLGAVDWKQMAENDKKIIDKFEMNIDPKGKIRNLPIAMQAMVIISKISVNNDIRAVIPDKPTALLENEKVEVLFCSIKELKENGASVTYISHRLEEIMDICDSVTVLKDGTYVDTKPVGEVTRDSLITMMVSREMPDIYDIKRQELEEEALRVENLSDSSHFEHIDFTVYKGEILGSVGLVGAGRSEIMRALCGVERRLTKDVHVKGKKVNIKNPSDAMHHGICFLTEDRRTDGLVPQLSIKTNINMNSYDMISKKGITFLKKESERTEDYSKRVNIKTPNILQLVGNLFGGNQQKAVIAKPLCRDPDLLILDEPAVGVDVGAEEEIYKLMEKPTEQGRSITLISSYLPEVIGLADRLIVMAQGKTTGELDKEELKILREEDVLHRASIEGQTQEGFYG